MNQTTPSQKMNLLIPQMLSFIFAVSCIIFAMLATFAPPSSQPAKEISVILFGGIVLILILLSEIGTKIYLKKSLNKLGITKQQKYALFFSSFLFGCLLREAVAVVGFAYAYLTKEEVWFSYACSGIAVVLILINFPRASDLPP